jgi:hypothetical protein
MHPAKEDNSIFLHTQTKNADIRLSKASIQLLRIRYAQCTLCILHRLVDGFNNWICSYNDAMVTNLIICNNEFKSPPCEERRPPLYSTTCILSCTLSGQDEKKWTICTGISAGIYSCIWCWILEASGSWSETPGKFWNVVFEKGGENQLDLSCEKWRSIT